MPILAKFNSEKVNTDEFQAFKKEKNQDTNQKTLNE